VNAHDTIPSFPVDIKGKLNLKVVIIISHFLDFEHLIEYLQLCLFHWNLQVACILSEPPPLTELGVYMPMETALTILLLSHRRGHRSLSIRSLVSCVYMPSRWPNPLMSFCEYYSGTFKPSMARRAYTPSLSTPVEEPLEAIGSRRTENLLLRTPSLFRKSLTNGTLRLRVLPVFPTPSRTYM
jgi:hypothetical protein